MTFPAMLFMAPLQSLQENCQHDHSASRVQGVAKQAMCALLGQACSLSAAVVGPVQAAVHSAAFQAWAGSAVDALDPAGGRETADAPEALRGVLCGELSVCAWFPHGAESLLY